VLLGRLLRRSAALTGVALGVLTLLLAVALPATAATARPALRAAGDAAPTFWSGTDSWPMPVGGPGPYTEPRTGGSYGGYIGMIGSWAWWLGCRGSFLAWSAANSAQANANLLRYSRGIGTGAYPGTLRISIAVVSPSIPGIWRSIRTRS